MDEEISFGDLPTKTYSVKNGRVIEKIDGLAAMEQHCKKTLETERFNYLIYTSYYGTEILDLMGQDLGYVQTAIESRVKEALLIDRRITSISDFKIFSFAEGIMHISFTANTIFGDVHLEKGGLNFNG